MKRVIVLMLFVLIANFVNAQTTVSLKLPNPCASVSIEKNVKSDVVFKLSPNPSNGRFTINLTRKEAIGKAKIVITDVKGAVVATENFFSNNKKCVKTLNMTNLSKGIYYVSIVGNGYTITKKLIIN